MGVELEEVAPGVMLDYTEDEQIVDIERSYTRRRNGGPTILTLREEVRIVDIVLLPEHRGEAIVDAVVSRYPIIAPA